MLIRIGSLSEQTGVSEDVIRSWERRYGLLSPQRTPGGFRLYGEEEIRRVHAMVDLIASGLSASEAARHLLETSAGGALSPAEGERSPLSEVQTSLHKALRNFDDEALEAAIDAALATVDLDTATREVFIPALRTLGDDWATGSVSVAQEHFSVNVLRGRLMALGRGWDQGFGPRALLACPPEEYHDVSLVLFGLALRRRGWRVTFLGANTPLADLALAQERIAPDITVLFAADWGRQAAFVSETAANAPWPIALAGATAGPTANEAGCRWLEGDPVSAAEEVTREFARRRRRGQAPAAEKL